MSAARAVRVEERDDRLVAVLDRPETRNAIDLEVVEALHDVCAQLEREPRLLLLAGADGVFASGADIAQLRERRRDDALKGINSRLFDRIRRLPLPTVAAVDGWALGGGAELAWACDLRVGTPRTVFGQPEPGLGILAGAGACWRLPELVGEAWAKQVLLGQVRLDADTARRLGLLVDVVEPDALVDRAHTLLDVMARQSQLALRLTKAAVDAPREAHPLLSEVAQAVLFEDEEKVQRMTAFLERRSR